MTETGNVTHENSSFNVIDGDLFVIHDSDNDYTRCEKTQNYLSIYFEDKLKQEFDFEEISLHIAPDDDNEGKIGAGATTTILATRGWKEAEKILIMTNNSSGSLVGIFSRSLCFEKGLRTGSVLNYVEKAREIGYAVMLLRPNTNSVVVKSTDESGKEIEKKVMIPGSESPELHINTVWEEVITQMPSVQSIALFGYGNGASLCAALQSKSMLSHKNLVHSFVTIEASHIVQHDDSADVREELARIAVNFEHSNFHDKGVELAYRKSKLGVSSISVGMPNDDQFRDSTSSLSNVAMSTSLATDLVMFYLKESHDYAVGASTSLGDSWIHRFKKEVADMYNITDAVALSPTGDTVDHAESVKLQAKHIENPKKHNSIYNFFFGQKTEKTDKETTGVVASSPSPLTIEESRFEGDAELGEFNHEKLTVDDFDLMKIVGKGAFGKVLLVRKKTGTRAGNVFAMKVLNKINVVANGQIEHALSERAILKEVKQPFICHLRFAFQNRSKLYMVTDFYNGGNLLMHIDKAKAFSFERTVFYAAEILSALNYLHSKKIIYRDLKLENTMMDHEGHLALIDFGLSKHQLDDSGAATFCGTPFYLAPELLKGHKYGNGVDYWSFGVLIYEMLRGTSPFFDIRGKRHIFMKIMKSRPHYSPQYFPESAINLLTGLLTVDPEDRLGRNGAKEIMSMEFFSSIDWEKLNRKEMKPPFVPDLAGPEDTKYVGKTYERMDVRRESTIAEKTLKKAAGRDVEGAVFAEFTYAGSLPNERA